MQRTGRYFSSRAQWASGQDGDPWVRAAQKIGYQCRSAFKLIQIDEKYKIFSQSTKCVLDVGCNPGSWIQVAASRSDACSIIVGVDRKVSPHVHSMNLGFHSSGRGTSHMLHEVENQHVMELIDGDITEPATQAKVTATIRSKKCAADVVQCDIAPDCSGDKVRDFFTASKINTEVAYFFQNNEVLRRGGHFVCKVLGGHEYSRSLADRLRYNFETVHLWKPAASRFSSSEQYIVALHFRSGSSSGPNSLSSCVREHRFDLDSWPGLTARRRL